MISLGMFSEISLSYIVLNFLTVLKSQFHMRIIFFFFLKMSTSLVNFIFCSG